MCNLYLKFTKELRAKDRVRNHHLILVQLQRTGDYIRKECSIRGEKITVPHLVPEEASSETEISKHDANRRVCLGSTDWEKGKVKVGYSLS